MTDESNTLSVTEGRKNLSKLMRKAERGEDVFTGIGRRRGKASVFVVGDKRARILEAIESPGKEMIARVATHTLLSDTPAPMALALERELAELSDSDLEVLSGLMIAKNPSEKKVKSVLKRVSNKQTFERLGIAIRVGNSIREAKEKGLYDVMEHRMSEAL
jgi:antitoxin (DNA-binding transcriptional repressor) of toxin-antitoxin stability system